MGYSDAWSIESDGVDGFTPLAVMASSNLRLGTAVVNPYTRGPAILAMTAASMEEVAPGRFVLGIGSSSIPIVQGWNGVPFTKPVTRVREAVEFIRQALTGERVVFNGETFQVNGYRLTRPPKQPVPIHVAALREGMLRMAGEVADGVCLNWLAVEDVAKCVGVVRAAAAAAGRDPNAIEVTARIFINIDPPGPAQDTAVRRHIAAYLNVPSYRKFHEWLGRDSLQEMWDAWEAGDRKAALAAIPEQVIDDLEVRGTLDERRAHTQRYLDAGVDTVFLAFATGEQDPERRASLIENAVRDHAPR
jgi:probable F420-dependent oxidoreductase